eukprot:CAMPEP_0171177136 /NCGR_PEP_ID=MMETSP0790-20130122/12087_1 /TAXON_ID=2925 /ORGANISM="Alexandrium catenella, Strain OF101" /LENGTH=87 /DNA_ID=CAMNT_0011642031 /DNA_START=96 /DNA_END=360 /DNA_ORIENTATION=-
MVCSRAASNEPMTNWVTALRPKRDAPDTDRSTSQAAAALLADDVTDSTLGTSRGHLPCIMLPSAGAAERRPGAQGAAAGRKRTTEFL